MISYGLIGKNNDDTVIIFTILLGIFMDSGLKWKKLRNVKGSLSVERIINGFWMTSIEDVLIYGWDNSPWDKLNRIYNFVEYVLFVIWEGLQKKSVKKANYFYLIPAIYLTFDQKKSDLLLKDNNFHQIRLLFYSKVDRRRREKKDERIN